MGKPASKQLHSHPVKQSSFILGTRPEISELPFVSNDINTAGHRDFHPPFMGGMAGMAALKTLQLNFRTVERFSHIATAATRT